MTAEVKPLIEEFEALPESAKREVLTMGVIKIAALSMVIMAIAIPIRRHLLPMRHSQVSDHRRL